MLRKLSAALTVSLYTQRFGQAPLPVLKGWYYYKTVKGLLHPTHE